MHSTIFGGHGRRAATPALTAVLTAVLTALVAGCVPPSRVGGAPATPAVAAGVWQAPDAANRGIPDRAGVAAVTQPAAAVPLALPDIVAYALQNSPLTRVSWYQARAAAAAYGSARGKFAPTLDLGVTGGPARSVSQNPARIPSDRTTLTPTAAISLVLFDFGTRGGAMGAAHEALFAADFTHNATVQNVMLAAEAAYFQYQAAAGLLDAAHQAVKTAEANLAAAEHRHDVGLAAIADVLQARTALAQSRLTEQGADGNLQAARAALALACGFAANAPFQVVPDSQTVVPPAITANVDSIIAQAVRNRPDVAAAEALARQGQHQVRSARGVALPSFTVGANRGEVYSNNPLLEGQQYTVTFGVAIPIFNGLGRESDIAAAEQNAAAAVARADQSRLQAVAQVFTSYWTLKTAAQRVATSAELLTSATQSEDVARGRYAEGVGSILDLLSAQSALADARAQVVQARWSWSAALAQLAHDAGTLTPGNDSISNAKGTK